MMWVGLVVGVLFGALLVRLGYRETIHPRYFGRQELLRADPQADGDARPFSLEVQQKLEMRDPRLATEPAVRVVTLFGLPIATEYAGLDARATYPGAPWYYLPSHWQLRLQTLVGMFGGLLGGLVAQQRALNEVRRQMARMNED